MTINKIKKSVYYMTQHIKHVGYDEIVPTEPLCTLVDQN